MATEYNTVIKVFVQRRGSREGRRIRDQRYLHTGEEYEYSEMYELTIVEIHVHKKKTIRLFAGSETQKRGICKLIKSSRTITKTHSLYFERNLNQTKCNIGLLQESA